MTFPIKKRIDTELFIDRTEDLNERECRNSDVNNKSDLQVVTSWLVVYTSDWSGSKFFDQGWVGSAIFGLGLENFP